MIVLTEGTIKDGGDPIEFENGTLVGVQIDLDDIEREVADYAKEELGYIDPDDATAYAFEDDHLIEVLEGRGYNVGRDFYYPNNSIRTTSAYNKLLDNIESIPIEEIEALTEKYNIAWPV